MRIDPPAPPRTLLSESNQTHLPLVTDHFNLMYGGVAGVPHGFSDVEVARDGGTIFIVGRRFDELIDTPITAVYRVKDGDAIQVSPATGSAASPRLSPDGSLVAYLSDAGRPGIFAAAVTALDGSSALDVPALEGTVEYLDWSPDGSRLLLGVAGLGAERAGRDGSGRNNGPVTLTDWVPSVESVDEPFHWRALWILDIQTGELGLATRDALNVWEARWCGTDHIVAVSSDHAAEDWWYSSELSIIDLETGDVSHPHSTPEGVQVAFPVASPEGASIAFIQATCSDRGIIAGDAMLLDRGSGHVRRLETARTDVTRLQWFARGQLGFVGLRGVDSVIGTLDTGGAEPSIVHSSALGISGAYHPTEAVFDDQGASYRLEEGYSVPQRLIRKDPKGTSETLLMVDPRATEHTAKIAGVAERITWSAPDGLKLEGFVCRPDRDGPFPLILLIHGGPVIAYRDSWAMGDTTVPLLVSQGYAVFCPNPRGSAGRGQDFVHQVVGDMGGVETHDFLSGIDHLASTGIYDGSRVGVMGCSYGGYMSAWLVTQDARFAAAVIMSPATDWFSQTYTSSLPSWTLDFLTRDLETAGSLAHTRSPALHATHVKTPCVLTAGAQDLCTPSGQSREFHRALRAHGTESTLVIYPHEGHGVVAFPAVVDHLARVLALFSRHMPADSIGG